ncbi:MAG: class I SAM-dependent methyltransferase [Proteobacteria bacterium]|nr:class I SAM-dependent methyltransferase [Pseudomonadota bacterium]
MNDTAARLSLSDSLSTRSHMARFIARRIPAIDAGALRLSLPNGGEIIRRGEAPGPEAVIKVCSWRGLLRVLFDGEHGFADAYLADEWSTPDLRAVLTWAMLNEDALGRAGASSWFTRLQNRVSHLRRNNTRRGSRRNIAAHYDLGNPFYQSWLDAGMNYSSAMYGREDTLETAQTRKIESIIELLGLQGGEQVLEIGCGWGALAERIVDKGCDITGLTLSLEQLAYARDRLRDVGNGATNIRLQDYRDVVGCYDRVVSIEMIEAVGERFWPAYFAKIRGVLKEGGIAVLQAITIDEGRFSNYRRNPDFIQRYIFPGGMLPTRSLLVELAASAGLRLVHEEAFGMSYARTLAEWRARFLSKWPRIEGMGFDQRFKRMWEYYLAYCEVGFHVGSVDVRLFKFVR